jgi:hypothetical protein
MIKTTARRVLARILWMARGTATMVGLAVMLALVLGVGTTALAAVPGDPFRLGRINAVDAASGLVGSVNGAMLTIENNSPGSKGAPASALSLKVTPGNLPLSVNPEAGTATGLSADELDGKDSTSFASATDGKANDADKLDGLDSTQIGINGYVNIRKESAFDSSSTKVVSSDCPQGTEVIGGGANVFASNADPNQFNAPIALRTNGPSVNGFEYWSATALEVQPYPFEWRLTVRVICADVGNP